MSLNVHGLEEMSQQHRRDQLSWGKCKQIDWLNLSQTSFGKVESLLFLLICLEVSFRLLCGPSANSSELKHQTFLVSRTPTGSIFAAWQPLRMSRRSWAAVTDFKTRVLRLKPEVQILGSSKSIRHTKVEILRLKSCFRLRKKETKLHTNLWKTFSNELFCRPSWWFHVGLLNDLHLARKPRPRPSSARPAMPFVNQERLVLKFPN